MKQLLPALVISSLCALPSHAEQAVSDSVSNLSNSDYKSSWGVYAETININSTAARQQGIGDSGFSLGFDYAASMSKYFNFSTGLSYISLDDKAEFSQRVENAWTGQRSTESSDVSGFSWHGDLGPQYSFANDKVTVGFNVGLRYINVDREISNCTNCYSESISIDNSVYFKPFINAQVSDKIALGLSYMSYQKDTSFDNSLMFKVSWLQ